MNRFDFHERAYDVIPQVVERDRLAPDNLGRYHLRAKRGEMIPLSTLVRVEQKAAANRLPQFNQMNAATLSAVLAPGVTMGQAVAAMEAEPRSFGVAVDWLGDSR